MIHIDLPYKDKVKHFLISFILASFTFWLTGFRLVAIAFVILLGVLKELVDWAQGKNTVKESMADMLVNILGITLGILFIQFVLL